MFNERYIPAPFFRLDDTYNILARSEQAQRDFFQVENFNELLDKESQSKFTHFMHLSHSEQKTFEVNLKTIHEPVALYELSVRWEDMHQCFHLLCMAQNARMTTLLALTRQLSMRLGSTDFALVEQKEALQSALEKMEKSAFENDKLAVLGRIAAGIAHEIRNPLTAIRGLVQLLSPDLKNIGKEHYSEIIITEINRVNAIISEFLKSSKPSKLLRSGVNVADLMNDVITLCSSEALLKGCELILMPIDDELEIYVDQQQLKQVLLNIVQNAVDAIAQKQPRVDHGFVEFEVESIGTFVKLTIRDNGKGMDQTTLENVFDPFYTTKDYGTGLGLSLCYQIVEAHGGTIDIESSLGKGTNIRIFIPAFTQTQSHEGMGNS